VSIAGYAKWAGEYATTFGLDRDSDIAMILAWEALFVALRVTCAELIAAAAVVGRNAPKWRSDHLIALQGAIRDARMARHRAELEAEEERQALQPCRWCKGSGWASVPHPRYVHGGEWHPFGGAFYTAVVACSCGKGRKIMDGILSIDTEVRRKKGIKVPLALEDYSRTVPDWPALLLQRERERVAERRAHGYAKELDKTFGQVLARLKPEPVPF